MIRLRLQLDSAFGLLEALERHLAAPGELLAPAVPVVAGAIERNFEQEGRPRPWAPLSPRYARWKERFAPGRGILELTGRLRRSIVARVEGEVLVASTDVPYAAAHQFGVPHRRLPARSFLVLTSDDVHTVAATIVNSLLRTLSSAPGTPPL